jgi:hypothetical protein
MGALRRRREGFVALLDAVLGDPGVEWAAEREDQGTRQVCERERGKGRELHSSVFV